jgi:ribosomal protein L5
MSLNRDPEAVFTNKNMFFEKNKELFEYDKYVGSLNFVTGTSFLDRYRECELQHSMLAASAPQAFHFQPLPTFSMASSFYIDMIEKSKEVSSVSNFPVPSLTAAQVNERHRALSGALNMNATSPIRHRKYHEQQRPTPVLNDREKYEVDLTKSLEKAFISEQAPFSLSEAELQVLEQMKKYQQQEEQQYQKKEIQASEREFLFDLSNISKASQMHMNTSRKQELPKLSDLLVDHSTRQALVSYKRMDESQKIEMLIGAKTTGRLSAFSTNLPNSIRKRLQSSARVNQRREQLYALLSQEYSKLVLQKNSTK